MMKNAEQRARELLIDEIENSGAGETARLMRNGSTDWLIESAVRAIARALEQREAVDLDWPAFIQPEDMPLAMKAVHITGPVLGQWVRLDDAIEHAENVRAAYTTPPRDVPDAPFVERVMVRVFDGDKELTEQVFGAKFGEPVNLARAAAPSGDVSEANIAARVEYFRQWWFANMPPGTVVSNPAWWFNRIAVRFENDPSLFAAAPSGEGE